MNNDEAKRLMRLELERDIPAAEREKKHFPIDGRLMSANELMAEVENDTKIGQVYLADFISFKAGNSDPAPFEREEAIAMMEEDIRIAPKGWADETIFNEQGRDWTPNQVLEEVRASTPFGLDFVKTYLDNRAMLEMFSSAGLNFSGTSNNDQSN